MNHCIFCEKKFFDEYGFAPAKLVDFKALRGDTSDNIPGVKGIGDKTAATLIKDFGSLENILARREEIKSKKIRAALENFSDDAIMSKRLAQIVCNVPEIFFSAEDFKIVPDFSGVEDFCNRYALNRLKKKIHDLFGLENLFSNVKENFLQVPEVQPLDFEKIFAAESLTVAQLENQFAIKISGGEIFSATRENLQRLFEKFNGKIILSGAKNYFK